MVFTFTLSAPAAAARLWILRWEALQPSYNGLYRFGSGHIHGNQRYGNYPHGRHLGGCDHYPVADATVEPAETVNLMIASGVGYDGGSPNSATGTITNDDTSNSDPLSGRYGNGNAGPDGFLS